MCFVKVINIGVEMVLLSKILFSDTFLMWRLVLETLIYLHWLFLNYTVIFYFVMLADDIMHIKGNWHSQILSQDTLLSFLKLHYTTHILGIHSRDIKAKKIVLMSASVRLAVPLSAKIICKAFLKREQIFIYIGVDTTHNSCAILFWFVCILVVVVAHFWVVLFYYTQTYDCSRRLLPSAAAAVTLT